MSFNLPMTPEDLPDYEYEAEVARLERNTGEIEEDDDDRSTSEETS